MKTRWGSSVPLITAFALALCLWPFSSFAVTLLSETFEGTFPSGNGWSVGDSNATGTAAYWDDVDSSFGGEGAHGGSWKGYCADIGHGGTDTDPTYQNSMTAYMSKDINLAGYTAASLTFWYKIPSIESNFDKLRVYMGATKIWERTTAQAAWTQVTLNLNAYAGATYTLKFEFFSDSSVTYEGAYLDDIVVTATAPEMDVRGNGVVIADGDTTPSSGDWTNFGGTTIGTTVDRMFYVHNTGTAPLLPGAITVPAGYTVTVGLAASIAAGSSDWFRVRLNAAAAGTYAGDISIANNDANENPYNFRITGSVLAGWDGGYEDLGGGWRRLPWFGDYIPMGGAGWIWHTKQGFLYIPPSAVPNSIWVYAQGMGWLWTSSTVYPFLYRQSDSAWLWYNGSSSPRWFLNMNTNHWEQWP